VAYLLSFLALLCEILTIIILIRVVMSWFSPQPTNIISNIVYQITEPILAPLRRIIPKVGIFDFTPMVAIILFQVIAYLLSRL